MIYLIQGIGILGAIIAFIAYLQKEHKRIVILRALCDACFTVHWLLQSVWVGMAMGIVCIIKDFTLAFAVEKKKFVKLSTIVLCVLYVAMGVVSILFSDDSIYIGILLIAANINGTVAYSIKNEIVMRIVDLPTEVVWLVYNARAVSLGGICCQSFIIVSILIALVMHYVKKKRRKEGIMIPDPKQKSARFAYRGVMLDCCRHFFTVEEIKKILSQMAVLKLNVFHWHLSNDQGFRFESKLFPKLNEISSFRRVDGLDPLAEKGICKEGEIYGGFYTQEEIKEVVSFAAEKGIEVVPELEMPAHATAILAAFPEYTCSGEPLAVASTFGIHDRIFCAGNEQVYEFLERLIDEVAALFPAKYFHIGGDEAPKSEWKNCPKCNAVMKKHGFNNYEQLQIYFTNRIIAHLKKLGKTPIVWNESVVEEGLDECAVVQYWMEMAAGESYCTKEFAKGRKFIFSNQSQFYCDYSYAETPLRSTLNFDPNVKGVPVPQENVLGIEAPMWTEWTTENGEIERMLYPRLLAVAECGHSEKRDIEEFSERAQWFLSVPELNFLTPMPWEEATIGGDEALKAIAENMLSLSARHAKMAAKQGKTAQAVVPEDAPQEDPAVAVYRYMKDKMQAAYTEADIRKVLGYISEMRSKA